MSAETPDFDLSAEYLAAGALVFNLGQLSLGCTVGYMVDQSSEITKMIRTLDMAEVTARGIIFEKDLTAQEPVLLGAIYTPDRGQSIRQISGSVIVTRSINSQSVVLAEISGHFSNPRVTRVLARNYRKFGLRTHEIGPGEAAQRIGTNILGRVVSNFHNRITSPIYTLS